MFLPPSAQAVTPDLEADRLGKARRVTGSPDKVLVDSLFAAETKRLEDGGEEVNMVRVRVTSDQWRPLPHDIDRRLMDVLREHWPVRDLDCE